MLRTPPRPAAALLAPICALLSACGPDLDYVVTTVPLTAVGEIEAEVEAPSIQITVDASFHQTAWGSVGGACDITVAFSLDQHDAEAQTGTGGTVMRMAEEPGECVVTAFGEDETAEAMEWDPPAYVDAGEALHLEDEYGNLTLSKYESDDGEEQLYRLADCNAESFPFGRALDIVLPDGVGAVPPTTVVEALVVPASLVVTSPPASALDQEILRLSQSDTFVIEWEEDETTYGEGDGYSTTRMISLRNQDSRDGNRIIEAVSCLPEDERHRVEVGSVILSDLTPNTESDPERYQIAGQVDIMTQGRHMEFPWGQEARMSTAVQVSGLVNLSVGGE